MRIRPSRDTLEALRATLKKLEQGLHPTHDVAELKRAILLRIAELETLDNSSAFEG